MNIVSIRHFFKASARLTCWMVCKTQPHTFCQDSTFLKILFLNSWMDWTRRKRCTLLTSVKFYQDWTSGHFGSSYFKAVSVFRCFVEAVVWIRRDIIFSFSMQYYCIFSVFRVFLVCNRIQNNLNIKWPLSTLNVQHFFQLFQPILSHKNKFSISLQLAKILLNSVPYTYRFLWPIRGILLYIQQVRSDRHLIITCKLN